jgi:hypothetical protein
MDKHNKFNIKSPLRYPGGKGRAVAQIVSLIPDFQEWNLMYGMRNQLENSMQAGSRQLGNALFISNFPIAIKKTQPSKLHAQTIQESLIFN